MSRLLLKSKIRSTDNVCGAAHELSLRRSVEVSDGLKLAELILLFF